MIFLYSSSLVIFFTGLAIAAPGRSATEETRRSDEIFRSGPRIAPVGFSGTLPVFFVAARDRGGLNAVFCAKLDSGVTGMAHRVANDAGTGGLDGVF